VELWLGCDVAKGDGGGLDQVDFLERGVLEQTDQRFDLPFTILVLAGLKEVLVTAKVSQRDR